MRHVIETFSLTKRFARSADYRSLLRLRRREDLTAVDEVTLQVGDGELFGLLGPNGAGKTTLIKMLCTLILPSAGQAVVYGHDVVVDGAAVRPLIGLIDGQERSFFDRLTGRQNLAFFAALYGLHGTVAGERIGTLLDLVGLSTHADRRFMTYSTGMRQRLAIARGLLSEPRMLFMDEPTRSLDPTGARELRHFIRQTLVGQLGCTVLLVTHNLEEAETLCDRVAIMDRGRVIACGPVTEIKRCIPAHSKYHLRVRHVPPQALDSLQAIPGVVQATWAANGSGSTSVDLVLGDEQETLPVVMRLMMSNGGQIQHCHAQGLSLEEAFVHLTTGDAGGA